MIKIDKNKIFFIYDGKAGKEFNEELTYNEMINCIDKNENKIIILVYNINEKEELNESIIKSNEIICPKCGELCKIKFNNYKISLYDCKNKHEINNLSFDEYEKSQYKDISKIKCEKCKENNMYNSFNKKFYRCNECNINLCLICKSNHTKNHKIINYKQLNYICGKHNKEYINYCKECKINICMLCNNEHKNHDIIFIGDIIINKNELENKIKEIKEKIDKFNKNIKEIIEIINEVERNINNYYKIIIDIINNYDIQKINYEILFNLKEVYNNNELKKDLKEINNDKNNINKFNNIINIYNKIKNIKNKNFKENEIKLTLDIEERDINKDIYFLDNTEFKNYINDDNIEEHYHEFLKELNELNTELYINNIKYNYKKYFKPEKEGIYHIIIKLNIQIKDCSFMFYNCKNLVNLDLSSFDTKNATNMKRMFYGCDNLINLDLSSFDTKNVTDMSDMFYECYQLKEIDLSSFDTKKVTDMSGMFYECYELKDIDLSSFDTKNVTDMSYMLYNCNNLRNINLSSFDTKKVTDMSGIFYECKNLKKIDLSSFDTKNVTNMSHMFYNCYYLKGLDLSSFDTKNVNDCSFMFRYCCLNKIIINKNSNKKIKSQLKRKDIEIKFI